MESFAMRKPGSQENQGKQEEGRDLFTRDTEGTKEVNKALRGLVGLLGCLSSNTRNSTNSINSSNFEASCQNQPLRPCASRLKTARMLPGEALTQEGINGWLPSGQGGAKAQNKDRIHHVRPSQGRGSGV